MEIERKYLVTSLPDTLEPYSYHMIEQGYLCTEPVVRIRRQDDDYFLTYKSKGLMVREEYNLALTRDAYLHLREKTDGSIISKKRVLIPLTNELTIELDIFAPPFAPLMMAEVEFPTEEMALRFEPPAWFGQDVTFDGRYHNSALSRQKIQV
ncbi:CYTH domain-containing protein [Diplocloster modestus]|uniref:CYTH domain-containing protein n=1 Tax=Diplocloster modestus TaxID=2850322 RepID=A0ABS6KDD9_9FIRM|nr:CYTH domain-containing protein [Diplocloster modestus]MBU9728527.1 CYTH domain-containing protein [Diplocloster modestus]